MQRHVQVTGQSRSRCTPAHADCLRVETRLVSASALAQSEFRHNIGWAQPRLTLELGWSQVSMSLFHGHGWTVHVPDPQARLVLYPLVKEVVRVDRARTCYVVQ